MKLGEWGEKRGAEYLQSLGYRIIERNFRCRIGEIDLIAMEGETLVFIEVKTRGSLKYGLPAESVTEHKKEHIRRTARWYVAEKHMEGRDLRLDVVELLRIEGKTYLQHIKNAF